MPSETYKIKSSDKCSWFELACQDERLSLKAVRVLGVLSSFINAKSGTAWPSTATIANKAHMSDRTVKRALDELERFNYINKHKGGGRGRTTIYGLIKQGSGSTPSITSTNESPTATVENSDNTDTDNARKGVTPVRKQCQPCPKNGDTSDPQTKRINKNNKITHAHPREGQPPDTRQDKVRLTADSKTWHDWMSFIEAEDGLETVRKIRRRGVYYAPTPRPPAICIPTPYLYVN